MKNSNVEYIVPLPKWIKAAAYAEKSGYTVDAIDSKRRNGVWLEKVQWIKAPDGKVFIDWRECDKWIEQGLVQNGKAAAGH